MGPISLYLGIQINHDRQRRPIELSMEAYIDNLAADSRQVQFFAPYALYVEFLFVYYCLVFEGPNNYSVIYLFLV